MDVGLKKHLRNTMAKKGLPQGIPMVAWPSGLRRWIKAPVSSEAWVQVPPLPVEALSSQGAFEVGF